MEIVNSRFDVALYRRYPDNSEKEIDFGPGYLKLYKYSCCRGKGSIAKTSKQKRKDDEREDLDEEVPKANSVTAIQVVFRSHGTMKVRANHVLQRCRPEQQEKLMFDTSFENELRYHAIGDRADVGTVGLPSNVYGKEMTNRPLDFPLAFEFHSEDDRDKFVSLLKQQLEGQHETESILKPTKVDDDKPECKKPDVAST